MVVCLVMVVAAVVVEGGVVVSVVGAHLVLSVVLLVGAHLVLSVSYSDDAMRHALFDEAKRPPNRGRVSSPSPARASEEQVSEFNALESSSTNVICVNILAYITCVFIYKQVLPHEGEHLHTSGGTRAGWHHPWMV